MIRIKPEIDGRFLESSNSESYPAGEILWQGIHVGVITPDNNAQPKLFRDLPIGHSAHWIYEVDLQSKQMRGPAGAEWLSRPLFESLLIPSLQKIPIRREVLRREKNVIILNCLDMMYGHCLLKLLNASRHLDDNPERGLIVLVPDFLRWLVPDGVVEIWSVPLGLSAMKCFYPSMDHQIKDFCKDFDSIWLSEAFSHPSRFRIEDYTRIQPHDFSAKQDLVTFIWREDRLWLPHYPAKKLRKAGLNSLAMAWQQRKVVALFKSIKRAHPDTRFAVVGLGKSGRFPDWVEDHRVTRFDDTSEKSAAQLYADSRIVIGVHGSNMLIPSALGGMTLDLVPDNKWMNHPQDTILVSDDARVAAFLNRFIPARTPVNVVAMVVWSMLANYQRIPLYLREDQRKTP
jgi:hypothetical protein